MNSIKKLIKVISLFILPMILPVIFLFLIFYSVSFLFTDQIIYYGYKSLISVSILILIFQLILDTLLSLIGLSPSRREKMSKDKFFTAFVLETAISFSSIILGYQVLKSSNMTNVTLFKSGLLFVSICFTIFDILFFLIYTKLNIEKYFNNLTK